MGIKLREPLYSDKKRFGNGGWMGSGTCTCRCGWVCSQLDEGDQVRKCEKCGTKFERKSYGWCQVTNVNKETVDEDKNRIR